MRIRKHASKILGVVAPASSCSSPPPQHAQMWAAPPSCSVEASAGGWQLCQLNCSPWDVMPISSLPQIYSVDDQLIELNEEKISVMEHGIKEDDEFHISSVIKNEKKKEIDRSDVKNLSRNKKNKTASTGEGEETAINRTPKLCKKSDGKNWKCKRLTTNHHSFCDYHINQMRSYNTSNQIINKKKKKPLKLTKNKRRNSKNSCENTTSVQDSSDFYYYAGIGTRSRKRRGGGTIEDEVGEDEQADNGVKEEISCFEEDDKSQEEMEKHHSKGRRKRVKARSLKSLL